MLSTMSRNLSLEPYCLGLIAGSSTYLVLCVYPSENYLTSLCFSFLTRKMGLTVLITGCYEGLITMCKGLRIKLGTQ